MKRIVTLFAALSLLLIPTLSSAQNEKPRLQARASIAVFEEEVSHFEVFPMEMRDGTRQYYLSLGEAFVGTHKFGVGTTVLEVFVYLGNTMDEALAYMQSMLPWFDEAKGTQHEVQGRLIAIQPDGELQPLQVTSGKTLGRWLEFSVEMDGAVLNANIYKRPFKSLISSVKFYRKLHPKEI